METIDDVLVRALLDRDAATSPQERNTSPRPPTASGAFPATVRAATAMASAILIARTF
jgi:hypothetical protein